MAVSVYVHTKSLTLVVPLVSSATIAYIYTNSSLTEPPFTQTCPGLIPHQQKHLFLVLLLLAQIKLQVAKEVTRMTHGHEQWCGDDLREWGCWAEGDKGLKLGTTVIT